MKRSSPTLFSETALYSLLGLTALLASAWWEEPLLYAAIAVGFLLTLTVKSWNKWTPRGGFGRANVLSWLRILLVVSIAVFPQRWLVFALGVGIYLLDGLDGVLARRYSEESDFGAALDKEGDAFFIASMCLWLDVQGGLSSWVLVAGLWRYAYGLVVALGPALSPAPRSKIARSLFGVAAIALLVSTAGSGFSRLWPACVATMATSYSFLRSLYWGVLRGS